ncbi:MAG: hypothetical protein QOG30_3323, partial [Acidimicrobiaceae bacterium]
MICAGCRRTNRDGAAFCAGCGARLVAVCAACGAELVEDARFCDGCGATVDGEAPSPATERIGTRKLVTILFADLSGSTSLQERLDVEATKRVMDRFHALLRAAI